MQHNGFKPGDMFGRYHLQQFLGAGGFAVVWKAHDTLTHTTVALKIFSSLDDQGIQELADEYARVHNLSHPGIVRAEHFDSLQNHPYLVMKICPGGNLEHAAGHISENEVLEMLRQMADALVYVHSNGLVHQDIKPANILTEQINDTTSYMLSDFGISAKSRTRLSKSVKDGAQSGSYLTFAYAPPEKFSSNRHDRMPDKKGDIFSLGITAYELATGHLPFDELDTGRELQYNRNISVDVSEIENSNLRNIISACLQADKNARPDASTLLQWIKNDAAPLPHRQSPRPVPIEEDNISEPVQSDYISYANAQQYNPVRQNVIYTRRRRHMSAIIIIILGILFVAGAAFLVLPMIVIDDNPSTSQHQNRETPIYGVPIYDTDPGDNGKISVDKITGDAGHKSEAMEEAPNVVEAASDEKNEEVPEVEASPELIGSASEEEELPAGS